MSIDARDDQPGGDAAWIARTRAALDDSVASLDGATLSALNRGRQRALDAGRSGGWAWNGMVALGVAASLALAVVLVRGIEPPPPPADTLDVRDLELVAGAEFELYEDWEFYAWLDAQQAGG